MKKAFFYALLMLFFSCSTEPIATIHIENNDKEIGAIFLTNEVDMMYDTITSFPSEEIKIDIETGPIVLQLVGGRVYQYVYMDAGSEVTITKNPGNGEFEISSSHQAEQDLLNSFSFEMQVAGTKYSVQNIAAGSESEFLTQLEKKYGKMNKLLAESEKIVSPHLIKMLEGRLAADRSLALVMYPQYYYYTKKIDAELSDDFYAALDKFQMENEKLYYFQDVKAAATAVIARGIDFTDFDGVAGFYGGQYKAVDSTITNVKVAELLKYELLAQRIQYAGGISGFEDEIRQFVASCKDPTRKSAMEMMIAKWEHLSVGKTAPNFSALTKDGVEVQLSDLKGKNVYIDVWATWCGPCIAEIPYLKLMENKYHTENVEFVSVSIDKERDRQKWMDFVEAKALGGTQLMTDNAWQSRLSREYNISGIPRFMLIDREGKIVDVNAPRPSNSTAFDKMMVNVLE